MPAQLTFPPDLSVQVSGTVEQSAPTAVQRKFVGRSVPQARPTTETDAIFVALVSELSTGILPAAVMALTYLGIAGYSAFALKTPLMIIAAVTGTLVETLKVLLMWKHQAALKGDQWERARARQWEFAHLACTVGFAAHVGLITAVAFYGNNHSLQVFATALLFTYCSGTVTRTAFRPVHAIAALCVSAIPSIIAAAVSFNLTKFTMASIFLLILISAIETVRYLYKNAHRQIAMSLDMALLARNDPLTLLLNRLGLREEFRRITASTAAPLVAVHCLDLDGFKPINDRHGHATGDEVLIAIADRLRASVQPGSGVARVGGDEFVVVQPIHHEAEAEALATKLSRVIAKQFDINGHDVRVGVSVGYATSRAGHEELEALLASADAALYQAKGDGRSGGGMMVHMSAFGRTVAA